MEPCPGSRADYMSSPRTRVNRNSALDMELMLMAQPIPVPAVLVLMVALGNKEYRNNEETQENRGQLQLKGAGGKAQS